MEADLKVSEINERKMKTSKESMERKRNRKPDIDAESKMQIETGKSREDISELNPSPKKQMIKEKDDKLVDDEDKPQTCHICSKLIKHTKNFRKHIMSHDPEFVRMRQQTHLCHICGKRLLNSTELNIHLRSHFNILLDSCEICGKSFLRRSTLNRHVRTVHSKERSYKCEQCDKSYTGKCALQRHQRIHSDPSTHFSCTHCDKKFALKSVLVEHEMTHSPMQGKIFNCSICPAKFFKPYLLKQHMRIHTKEKPYICECGKSFSQKGNLNVHQKTHKGFKKFQCTQCDKGFTRVEYLLRHEEEKHSEEPGHLKKKIEQSSNIQTRSPSLDVKLASHNLKAKLSQTRNPPSKRKQSTKMVEANKISVIQTDEEPVKEEMSIEIKSFGEESLKEEMNIESKNCVKSTVEKTSTVKEEETTIDQWITGLN